MKKATALIMGTLICAGFLNGCSCSSENVTLVTYQENNNLTDDASFDIEVISANQNDDVITFEAELIPEEDNHFKSTFDSSMISFGDEFAEASNVTVDEINKESGTATISFDIPANDLDIKNLTMTGSITLAEGSLVDYDGDALSTGLSVTEQFTIKK